MHHIKDTHFTRPSGQQKALCSPLFQEVEQRPVPINMVQLIKFLSFVLY